MVIGPRIGKYDSQGRPHAMQGLSSGLKAAIEEVYPENAEGSNHGARCPHSLGLEHTNCRCRAGPSAFLFQTRAQKNLNRPSQVFHRERSIEIKTLC